jgi:hypothetical protein
MQIEQKQIPHKFRNKYLQNVGAYTSGSSGGISSLSSGKAGLPYTLDKDGNYVIDKKVTIKGDIISEAEVVAYQLAGSEYIGTYAPLTHTHQIADVNGLQTALDAAGNSGVSS